MLSGSEIKLEPTRPTTPARPCPSRDGGGQEDDPAHERQRLEEEIPAQLVEHLARAEDVFE